MRRVRLLVLAAITLVVGCTGSAPGPVAQAGPQIEIASEFPLRGAFSFPDLDRIVGIALAEQSTVEGYRLVHVTLDDSLGGAWNLDRALQNMRRAVREPSILGVVGPWSSFQAQFLVPLASSANLAVLSPSNTMDCLTDPSPCLNSPRAQNAPTNYFRIAARDTLMARAAADFAVHTLSTSQFAVLTNPIDTPFAEPMAAAFSDELAKLGGKVVYSHDFFPLVSSFAPMLRDARAAGAEAIYMSAGVNNACALRKDMNGVFGTDAYLIAGDRLGDDGCVQQANLVGKTDDHFVLTMATAQPRTIPSALKVLDTGHGFHIYTLAAYDCANILIDAVRRAIRANGGKIPTREQVRQAVAETLTFKGVTGIYSFEANGDVVTPGFSFWTIQGGHWQFWQSP